MRLESLTEVEWRQALESLPAYPFFVTPRFVKTWIRHFDPRASPLVIRVTAPSGAWRLAAMVQVESSRFGTRSLVGAPEGGCGVAGVGSMPADWLAVLMGRLQRALTDTIELNAGQIEDSAALGLPTAVTSTLDTWVVTLGETAAEWVDGQIDKRVRRQLRLSEAAGVRTQCHGVDGLDRFYALYQRVLDQAGGHRPRYSKAFLRDLMLADGPGQASLYLSSQDDRLLAGGLLLRGGADALAWIGSFDRDFADRHANVHRHYTVVSDLCASGIRRYGMGAAPGLTDVTKFKQKLGAEPIPSVSVNWRNPALSRLRRWLGRD